MSILLSIALGLLSLQSADESPPVIVSPGAGRAAAYSDGEIAELVQVAIISDLRGRAPSADQLGRAAGIRPDVDVAQDVENVLREKLKPTPNGLNVSCSRGNVQLRGQVENDSDLRAATELAKGVNGVRAVLNRMTYPDQTATDDSTTAPEELPTRVGPFSYLTSDGLAARGVVVDVHDGEVSLSGVCSSPEARGYAVASASRVPGARTVRNNMALRPTDQQVDRRLALLVAKKFEWDQSLHGVSDNISVTVRNGILTLTGKVDTEQQAELVRQLAANTESILVVDDKLNVTGQTR
jgi:osmotically-inducible protein OsmY